MRRRLCLEWLARLTRRHVVARSLRTLLLVHHVLIVASLRWIPTGHALNTWFIKNNMIYVPDDVGRRRTVVAAAVASASDGEEGSLEDPSGDAASLD